MRLRHSRPDARPSPPPPHGWEWENLVGSRRTLVVLLALLLLGVGHLVRNLLHSRLGRHLDRIERECGRKT
jgi:hypothetical protein